MKACLIVFIIMIFLIGGFIYLGGGYWENLPLLNKISGKQRFQQFVINPIPASIFDVKGGYSGFPKGKIETDFRFSGDFLNYKLTDWEIYEKYGPYEWFVPYMNNIGAKIVFRKKGSKATFLLINNEAKRGKLLVF